MVKYNSFEVLVFGEQEAAMSCTDIAVLPTLNPYKEM